MWMVQEEKKPEVERGYRRKKTQGKGKGRARELGECAVFDEERRWVEAYLAGGANGGVEGDKANAEKAESEEEELEDDRTFIECWCCFSTYTFERMAQSPTRAAPACGATSP
ncbi:hypothetical protein FA15DRAFT_709598 [Coprinopsis marcescibilis]|uniref:Uncharacterized protein n=1 Tax=Coprinopsis marcescibilis TaxID=230819 RepID=A0A5C3KF30_COPMA|nr:hypothetical protein FA15DRAFT_709598 [Coprinopsis marcescibilis]